MKNTGVRKMPNSVTPNMPLKTAVPSVRRISAPAPWAINSGNTPRMKAKEVITIGRRRSLQASRAASRPRRAALAAVLGELHDQDRVLAGQPDQHHEADLGEDIDVHLGVGSADARGNRCPARRIPAELVASDCKPAGTAVTPTTALSRHMGTTRITASGSDQLSYWAASTRNTMTTARPKMIMAVLPACNSR